jgi:GBP family porin
MRPFFGALLSRYWTTMKLLKFAPLAIAGALSSVAHAQSSVTLYGLISAGVGYATNQARTRGRRSRAPTRTHAGV